MYTNVQLQPNEPMERRLVARQVIKVTPCLGRVSGGGHLHGVYE